MLQSWGKSYTYEQPVHLDRLDGQRFTLPPDFVQGLDFLRPFTVSRDIDMRWVRLVDGRLFAASNSLIVEYEIGPCELKGVMFLPKVCRILAGFATAPEGVVIRGAKILFTWTDGQELLVDTSNLWWSPIIFGGSRIIADTFNQHWTFGVGTAIDDETRTSLRRMFHGAGNGRDVFLDGQAVLSRNPSRTIETEATFTANTERLIRFDRKPFLAMLKVATEIDFAASPLCFRHAHGRGMLVRRTLGRDVPTFGGDNG